jgi:hypothetical protein
MTDTIQSIKDIEGVQYVTEYDGSYRVVFKHNADSTAVHKVERETGCSGKMGGTQEHLPCVDYPIDEVDA